MYAEALAHEGRADESDVMLEKALDRAENAGFLRLFAEESASLRDMLLDFPRLRTPGRGNRGEEPGEPKISMGHTAYLRY